MTRRRAHAPTRQQHEPPCVAVGQRPRCLIVGGNGVLLCLPALWRQPERRQCAQQRRAACGLRANSIHHACSCALPFCLHVVAALLLQLRSASLTRTWPPAPRGRSSAGGQGAANQDGGAWGRAASTIPTRCSECPGAGGRKVGPRVRPLVPSVAASPKMGFAKRRTSVVGAVAVSRRVQSSCLTPGKL